MNRKHLTTIDAPGPERRSPLGLEREIRAELLALSFNAFERCAGALLRSLGYEDVHVRRDGKEGRNRDGGWDIEATLPTGLTRVKVIAQIKQYDTVPVQKRYVDELRGAMLRTAAGQGLLIALSTFPDTAKLAAASTAIAPIRLIDGGELARLMISQGIGVAMDDSGRKHIDRGFFELLGRSGQTSCNRPAGVSARTAVGCGTPIGATVTIVVTGATPPPRIVWKEGR